MSGGVSELDVWCALTADSQGKRLVKVEMFSSGGVLEVIKGGRRLRGRARLATRVHSSDPVNHRPVAQCHLQQVSM